MLGTTRKRIQHGEYNFYTVLVHKVSAVCILCSVLVLLPQNLEDEEKLKGDNGLKPLGKINGWKLTEEVYGRGL